MCRLPLGHTERKRKRKRKRQHTATIQPPPSHLPPPPPPRHRAVAARRLWHRHRLRLLQSGAVDGAEAEGATTNRIIPPPPFLPQPAASPAGTRGQQGRQGAA